MLVDKIYNRFYDATLNKFIVIARVKIDNIWCIKAIPFVTEIEMDEVKIGDYINR